MAIKGNIFINTGDGKKYFHPDEILFLEAKGKRTEVILKNGNEILANHNLRWFQDNLPKEYFIRIHKSFIVNKTYVKAFTANMVTINQKNIIPVGRCYKNEFEMRLRLLD
ncbi:MAG: LytR/AlgR family response regulator transcription factor [Bacteroidales bacterium]